MNNITNLALHVLKKLNGKVKTEKKILASGEL